MILRRIVLGAFSALLAVFFLSPNISHAQAVYGSIYGTVTDSTGAAVPGATVTVTDESKGDSVTATTNASGAYTVQHLIVDYYDVKVTAPGFEAADNPHVHVYVDTAPKVDVVLKVGAASQTVQVTSAAPLLNTSKADVAMILNDKYMVNLPVQNRNFTSMELLLPGAQLLGWSHASDENPQGSRQIQIDGQYFNGVGYELDGTDNQDPILGIIIINPIPDDVNEAKMTTQNYDSEFGMAVSSMITVSTKSGTNQIHGTAYDYRQSSANLARDSFNQFTKSAIPPALQNQFGGAIGGPIKKNKLFYFGGYEGFRQRVGTTNLVTVPTPLAKSTCSTPGIACNLSDYLNPTTGYGPVAGQIYDPTTAGTTPFSGNIIPSSRVNGASAGLIKQFPNPNVGAVGQVFNNYTASGNGIFNTDQFDVRIDDVTSQNMHAFGRYSFFRDHEFGAPIFGPLGGVGFGIGGYGGNATGRNQSVAAGADYAIHPTLFADLRFGWHQYKILTSKYDGQQPFATDAGIPGLNVGGPGETGGAPGFYVNGNGGTQFGSSLGINRCNCPLTENEQQWQIVNDWTKTAGNHTIKFGADLRYATNLRIPSDSNRAGDLSINSSETAASNGNGGLGFATFMLGDVDQLSRYVSNVFNASEQQKRTFFYAQDTWHPNSNWTLNYGLRYEIYFPETVNGKEHGALLNLHTGNLQVAGEGPYGTNMGISNNYSLFAPRLGVAYQPNPKTVIRAGYGRSYDIGVFGSIFGHASTQNLPVLAAQDSVGANNFTPAFTFGGAPPKAFFGNLNPTTGNIPLPNGINAHSRPMTERLPTLDAWNLSLENQVSRTVAVTLAYVGNKGSHTFTSGGPAVNPNQLAISANGFTFNPPSATNPAVGENPNLPISPSGDVRRLPYYYKYGWTQGITYYADSSNTHYNALQLTVQKQLSRGLQLTANYAWQRAYNYGSNYYSIDPATTYGLDGNLREQSLTSFATWLLPIGRNGVIGSNVGPIANAFIGGWELDTILTVQSGLPWTPGYQDQGQDRDTGPTRGPNLIQNAHFSQHLSGYNPALHTRTWFTPVPTMNNQGQVSGPFRRPFLDQIGDIQRDAFTGPGFWDDDLTLQKNISLKSDAIITLRMDAFNAFNHTNPGNPSNCVDCTLGSGAGQIFGLAPGGNPRQLQFALRFTH
jgi:hypothetical protein